MTQNTAPEMPPPRSVAEPLDEAGAEHRGLPTPRFLLAVLRRNALLALLVGLAAAPFGLAAVMLAPKTHESNVLLRFDPSDTLDVDGHQLDISKFTAATALVARELGSQDYFIELAGRYAPEDKLEKVAGLPIVGPLARRLMPHSSDKALALLGRAKSLRTAVKLATDMVLRNSYIMRLTVQAETPDDAQRLASVSAQLLIDRFYEAEVQRVRTLHESLKKFMANEQVKVLAEKARNEPPDPESAGYVKGGKRLDPQDRRMKQVALQERMKELSTSIQLNSERKQKLEAQMAEMSQRYGPFHPQIKALQSQIAELHTKGASVAGLENEQRTLEEQLAQLDLQSADLGLDFDERLDKTIRRLNNRIDRVQLERIKLEQQLADPLQRTRMMVLGSPTNESEPVSSKKAKVAALSAALIAGLAFALILLRELLSTQARDPWRISFQLNLPCAAEYQKKVLAAVPDLDPGTIADLRSQLSEPRRDKTRTQTLIAYRNLTHWLRHASHGRIILFARGSEGRSYGRFLDNVANVMASDYAGKTLVVDLNSADPVCTEPQIHHMASLIDVLLDKSPLTQAIIKGGTSRGYDVVRLTPESQGRLPELISSTRFVNFLKAARTGYGTILVNGFGPERFVENGSLIAHTSDCVLLIDGRQSRLPILGKLVANLKRDRLRGYVHLAAVLLATLIPLGLGCTAPMSSEDIGKAVEGDTFTRVGDYKIGPGDILNIKIFGEDSLSGQYVVAPSGTIQVPLIGFVPVQGISQVQVSRKLEQALNPFVRNAKAAVSVNDSQSYQVFFSGEVQTRGPKELKAKTNMLQGIIMAGGLTPLANGKIYLIRRLGEHQVRRYKTTYTDLLRGKDTLDFMFLERGDIIHAD